MIELQVLNYILENKSLLILRNNNITQDFFVTYAEEAAFIYRHYEKYQTVPDKETFLSAFTDFDLFIVAESEQYLVETLREQHLYNKMVPFVNQVNELVAEDSEKAIKYAKEHLQELAKVSIKSVPGYDIIKNALERGEEYELRLNAEGLLGITTGIPELDEITHGWLPGEELVVIVGRTNEGKTWVLLMFLVAAWKAGKRILLYSGEMSKDIVGFRVDTLSQHFSHTALTHGTPDLGDGKTPEDYKSYLDSISKDTSLPPFIVVTPKDLGKRLDVPTLETLIEQYKPDIVGLDQLSLMDDARSGVSQQERTRFTHISEDLYTTSEKYGVPILTPSQASRQAVKKSGDDNEETPDLHEISESDGIGQNATRVIGMRQIGNTLKLSLRKSRYSKKNSEILVLWDIDRGIVKPFMQVQNDSKGNVTSTKPSQQSGIAGSELF